MVRISKTIAGISALAMAAAVVLPTTPASAFGWRGGWHGGWAGRGAWHPGFWRGGYWVNGWWGPAIAAGVLTGAAIATAPYWAGGYGYRGCWQYRPTYDAYGNFLGQQAVNVC